AAKRALDLLLEQEPHNAQALRELGYWNIAHNNKPAALANFQQAHQNKPNDAAIALQLAKLLIAQHQTQNVSALLEIAMHQGSPAIQQEALALMAQISLPPITLTPQTSSSTTQAAVSPEIVAENPLTLLNLFAQYYATKQNNPIAAQIMLYQIIQYYPDSSLAYSELGYTQLTQGDKTHALANLIKSFDLAPNAQVAAQIGYILIDNKNLSLAKTYFEKSYLLGDASVKDQISLVLSQLEIMMLPHTPAQAAVTTAVVGSERDQLMNQFYALKKTNPQAAWNLLLQILTRYPDDVDALKEAGYISLADSNYKQALPYFERAYKITSDPVMALQAGYISSTLGNQPKAYGYFEDATTAPDASLAQKAQQAMTNIGGLQLKVLPSPFFFDLYYAPIFFSRFALIVNPVIARAGITLNQKHNAQLYLIYRWTRDNRSGVGQISTIYQDDTAITSIGGNIQPFVKIPLVIFAQVGKAYNLLNIHPRWRNDVRAGAIFYDQWGAQPIFSPTLDFPFAWISTLYSNVGYYSRYENDVIADSRLREGFRVLRYHPSAIDVYLDEHLILDSQQQFYNNIFEIGPGIVFYPSNRYNVDLRLESLRGYYLPVNSPSPNPYGPTYRNNEILFETYLTI
ncbi:MAG: tetratricopeptide repeat protein, partial [Gammaproteobacteria bacterium]